MGWPRGAATWALALLLGAVAGPGSAGPVVAFADPGADRARPGPGLQGEVVCRAVDDADRDSYYRIELVPTRNVTGTAFVRGYADVTFLTSPYGISLAADGSYRQNVHLRFDGLRPAPPESEWVAWVTTTQVDQVQRIGALDEAGRAVGPVSWNKFLVVVTLEPRSSDAVAGEAAPGVPEGASSPSGAQNTATLGGVAWSGPIAFRGMSRSGMMHTMVGHGPLQDENCAAYGFSR